MGPNKQMQMMIYVVDDCLAGSGMRKTYAAGDWIQDPLSEFMRAIGIGLEIKTAQRPRGGRRAETWKTGKWETLRRRNQEAGVTDRAAEDGKIGNASSGLRIARTVGTTEVAVKAQQGAVNLVAHSDRRAAATTRMEEGAEGTTEVAATAQQGAVTPVAHSDRRAAATTRMEEGAEGTMEVAATAQQGAVAPVSHNNGQAAAETVVEEGSEDWQMGNAGVEAAAAAAGRAADWSRQRLERQMECGHQDQPSGIL